nr:hypothetical protein [Halomicronema hongdechloris]
MTAADPMDTAAIAPPSCTLSIMVARTDIPFIMQTLPHLVRMCRFPFQRRILVMDTAPLSGDKVGRPGIGTLEQLRDHCQQLIHDGVMDEVIEMDYSPAYRRRLYQKHFGSRYLQPTHNYKGYPILGTIFSLEKVPGDYVLHFDSDMLLYQHPDHSWIREAIQLLQRRPEVMFVRPLSGPPHPDGALHQRVPFEPDPAGFYRFKFFGSRVYLLQRRKFESLLPLPILWCRYRRAWLRHGPASLLTWLHNLTGRGALDSWEVMVSRQLEQTAYVRATLASPLAWTVHPVARGPAFIAALPDIIRRVEAGQYPPEQAGYYDLKPELWY